MMNKYLARGKETPTETYLIQIQIKKCLKYKEKVIQEMRGGH